MRSVSPPRFYGFAVVCRPKLKTKKSNKTDTKKSANKKTKNKTAAKKGTWAEEAHVVR